MKPTLSTAAASGSVAFAIVVLIQWILTFWHIALPTDAASAILTILAAIIHWLAVIHIFPAPIDDAITKETKP